jgi:hypothetical protein
VDGQIRLYDIEQQQIKTTTTTTKLIQTFPQEHPSYSISCLLEINPNTLVSSSSYSYSSSNPSDNVIVIWSKSKSTSPLFEPIQRITRKEAGREIKRLVLIKQKKEEEEELFASCSFDDNSIIIWGRRGKGGKGDKFQIKQKILNVRCVLRLLYISQTNELIFESSSPSSLLQIWSTSPPSSSSSSDFVEKQKIETSSWISSLCQLNRNNDSKRIEFASGHSNGQIMIWSKQQQQINGSEYSLIKTFNNDHLIEPFNNDHEVYDLIFLNDNEFNFLISCSPKENKIKIFKEEEEEEELEHEDVRSLIPMSNGQFASGGYDQCLNIWSPSLSSLCS